MGKSIKKRGITIHKLTKNNINEINLLSPAIFFTFKNSKDSFKDLFLYNS